ncbi:DUF493 domain-containing protein [uncultured Helicobacter sp.]|uniref:HP0495 family protein n=1 Tax=uncultured Helicobacter sp. TaxID=175537 RepID=UPI002606CDAC|nr:DUF493 domain-containing protein [uncultured Helicobacter sp.]
MNLDIQKPHIVYPCKWEYRVIGTDEEVLRKLIFDITLGKHSSKGHFVSLYVSLEVQNEEERNAIFAALQVSSCVKMVL